MRHSKWLAAALFMGVGATALSACHRTEEPQEHRLGHRDPMHVIDRLDCPETQGALRRVSAAADGQSCAYESPTASVDLRLVRLNGGDAEAALSPIEAELKGVMPLPPAPTPPKDAKSDKNHASIHLPGVSIDAHGDTADIRIGHLTINSDGGAAEVKVSKNVSVKSDGGKSIVNITADEEHGGGDVAIRATDSGAEVRAKKGGDDVRSTLILANDKAPKGFRLAGYEARGPKGGPLAVAVVKAKTRDTDDHDLFKDMKALVRHNVGG
ncbi:hypothetical protein [Caulobacter sp. BP25]|uniref:hypothetical protein n=1 Tax=Caulobacter sp. BP25 TaxID=2048900 RepID=UPI000C12A246|nr:hypothetical protein [Caulobacter sp. BP25]PHY20203.1 hypothetical protein CSW59_08450 [Caulobacter sp. BP25]